MSQNTFEQAKSNTMSMIESINAIDGFDPMTLAIKIGDLNDGGMRHRLPVMSQMAWFRLKYPEGRIAVSVKPASNFFVAEARVYASYKDPVECYLGEGSATRGAIADKPTVSPREWAQTAAIGIALRNAGFGLQFAVAGESFEDNSLNEFFGADTLETPNALMGDASSGTIQPAGEFKTPSETVTRGDAKLPSTSETASPQTEQTPLEKAMAAPCPIKKYAGKTLGDLIRLDPSALVYIAKSGEKYSLEISEYAKLICEVSLQQAS